MSRSPSRREFLKASTVALTSASAAGVLLPPRWGGETLRLGLVGCGGRGTGAAVQALKADADVRLVAMADAFEDRLTASWAHLQEPEQGVALRVAVPPERRFVGFDAYERLLESGVDVVILATPPHFRPQHFEAAVKAKKHVFLEKPVAVDGPGIKRVLEAGTLADRLGVSVACGLQRHHQNGYVESIRRVHEGAIGEIVAARCYWNMGALWMNPRQPAWSDMEWQLRNWLYFTWLSGDHIVEQHVHNLDVINWAKKSHPVSCFGSGGRQCRTDAAFGHIFDHHDVHFEYEDGTFLASQCRQIEGCAPRVSEHLIGTRGRADLNTRRWTLTTGDKVWEFDGAHNDPYQTEHDDLFAAIRAGRHVNESRFVAESTLTAIMGRMATYSGKVVTWNDALESRDRLGPNAYAFGELPVPGVPMPGR